MAHSNKYQPTLVDLPQPDSVEIKSKMQFIQMARVDNRSDITQLDVFLKWDY